MEAWETEELLAQKLPLLRRPALFENSDMKLDALAEQFAEKYLGSLPSIHRKESWKDVGVHTPTDVVVKRVEKGVEPKSLSAIVFTGPFEYSQASRIAIAKMFGARTASFGGSALWT